MVITMIVDNFLIGPFFGHLNAEMFLHFLQNKLVNSLQTLAQYTRAEIFQ